MSNALLQLSQVALHTLSQHRISGCRVLIATSGGLDSTALYHVVEGLSGVLELDIHCLYVNHGWRSASEHEADIESVRSMVGGRHALHIRSVQESAMSESAARDQRYSIFAKVAGDLGASTVLTAHHIDDSMETFFINLVRGAGIRGLAGISDCRQLHDSISVIRPFLNIERKVIREAAEGMQWTWVEDSSNADTSILRNAIRASLLPAFENVFGDNAVRRASASFKVLGRTREALEELLTPWLKKSITEADGGVCIQLHPLTDVSDAVLCEVISFVMREYPQFSLRSTDVSSICELRDAAVGSQRSLARGGVALRDRDYIFIGEKPSWIDFEIDLSVPGDVHHDAMWLSAHFQPIAETHVCEDKGRAWLDSDAVRGSLRWRPWRDGDRFQPFGFSGSVLVSDLLTNSRVPVSRRKSRTVVCDDEGILWVCGIRPAERARIHESTRNVVVLSYEEPDIHPLPQTRILDRNFRLLIAAQEVSEILGSIAAQIDRDYYGKHVTFVVILRGAFIFAADLVRRVKVSCNMEFVYASSYGDGTRSIGRVEINARGIDVLGRHVVIVEDIVDTGNTIIELIKFLSSQNPASITVAALLSKPTEHPAELVIDYVGKEIPSGFVIGYGMDYAGMGRNLESIYTAIEDDVITNND